MLPAYRLRLAPEKNNDSLAFISFNSLIMITEVLYPQQAISFIQWKSTGELPSANSDETSLGFAGLVARIHNNILVVAGDDNFPAIMPWVGRKKKCYDCGYLFKGQEDSFAGLKFNCENLFIYMQLNTDKFSKCKQI